MIDLLVVGGGPVGLVSAIHAAEAGLEVTVLEPRSGSIDKACGEGLMPKALEHLASIGVDPDGMEYLGISYKDRKNYVDAKFSGKAGRGVRRTVLHDALMQRATELKVNFIKGRVHEISQSATLITAGGIESRYLIGADGLHSTVRDQLGLSMEHPTGERARYGIRQHFSVAPWSPYVEVYWLPGAEIYITPVDAKTVGVAILGGVGLDLQKVISQIPELSKRLSQATPASKVRGAGPLRQRVSKRTSGRALLVGDAGGYVDALTGEGLQVGFAEAQAAVQAILRGDIQSYEREWRRLTRPYRLRAGGLLWVSSRKIIRPLIVPAAKRVPYLFNGIVNSLG
jgi:flavin-dependent dehydrogenase